MSFAEGKHSWWGGWASNPVVGAMRRRVGSTPASFRHEMERQCPQDKESAHAHSGL